MKYQYRVSNNKLHQDRLFYHLKAYTCPREAVALLAVTAAWKSTRLAALKTHLF